MLCAKYIFFFFKFCVQKKKKKHFSFTHKLLKNFGFCLLQSCEFIFFKTLRKIVRESLNTVETLQQYEAKATEMLSFLNLRLMLKTFVGSTWKRSDERLYERDS